MDSVLLIQAPDLEHIKALERLIIGAFPEHHVFTYGRRAPEIWLEVKVGMHRTNPALREGMLVALDGTTVVGGVRYRTAEMCAARRRHQWSALQLLGLRGALRFMLLRATLLRTYCPASHVIYLHDLVVDPAYRRRGIGTRLLDEVCIAGRRMGKQVVMCHVNGFNTASRQLMTRYGFRQVTQRWSVVSALIFKQPEFLSLEKGLAPDWDAQTSLPLPLQSWEQQ